MKDCLKKAKFMEIDCDEIIVPFAVPQGCWLVQNLHFVIIFARVVQIAFVAIGFYTWYCRWQVAISALRFSVFTSVQLGFSSFLRVFFLFRMRGNLLIYRKMSISRLLWGDRWKLHERRWSTRNLDDKHTIWGIMFVVTSSCPPWRLINFF